MEKFLDRKRINTDQIKCMISEEDDSTSSCSPIIKQRQRAQSRRDSIRSELKLHLLTSNACSPKIQRNLNIFKQKYETLNKIGEGGSSVVKKCRIRGEKEMNLIVKIMKFKDSEDVFRQIEEFNIGRNLNHPSIVKFEELILEKNNQTAYLVQEYARGDSITTYMFKRKRLNEKTAKIIMNQVFQGVSYLHKQDICHRDLHSGNIIYDQNNQRVKIIDFSISRKLYDKRIKMITQTGIVYYMAPEQLDGSYYTKSVDIWTLGILLYFMMSGTYPFLSDDDLEEEVVEKILKKEVEFPEQYNISEKLQDLLKKMLQKDHKKRINIKQVLNHPWIKEDMFEIYKESVPTLTQYPKTIQSIISENSYSDSNSLPGINEELNTGHSLLSQNNNINNIRKRIRKATLQHITTNGQQFTYNKEKKIQCNSLNSSFDMKNNYDQDDEGDENDENVNKNAQNQLFLSSSMIYSLKK